MSDFKVGDKVFYFWHSNTCSLVWDLNDIDIMSSEITGFNNCGHPLFDKYYDFTNEQPFFKSKNEAIDAMMAHLDQLRDSIK